MNIIEGLRAIVTVSQAGLASVLVEISDNEIFKGDIEEFNSFAPDVFDKLELPTQFGFYLFTGQARVELDFDGLIDGIEYTGEFNKIAASTLVLYLPTNI